MPRDSSGVYTLPIGNPVVTNTIIASGWANDTMGDIAAQLNNVITRDGLLGPTGPFRINDGTVAAPGLAFAAETQLGWYREGTGKIGMSAAGQKRALFDFAGGVASLSLNSGATFNASLFLNKGGSAAGNNIFGQTDSVARWLISLGDGVPESGANAGSDYALTRYTDAGVAIDSPLLIRRSSGAAFMGVQLSINQTSVINGGLFIGAGGSTASFTFQTGATRLSMSPTWFWSWDNVSGDLTWVRPSAINTVFNASGELHLGGNTLTLAPDRQMFMQVAPSVRLLQFAGGYFFEWQGATGNLRFVSTGAVAWEVTAGSRNFVVTAGAFKPGGGVWSDSSDVRVKHDIRDYSTGLDAILSLSPKVYKFKPETGRDQLDYVGLIYQETEAMPEMRSVRETKLGEVEYDDMGTLDTTPLVYALINSTKELHERIAYLEAHARAT